MREHALGSRTEISQEKLIYLRREVELRSTRCEGTCRLFLMDQQRIHEIDIFVAATVPRLLQYSSASRKYNRTLAGLTGHVLACE